MCLLLGYFNTIFQIIEDAKTLTLTLILDTFPNGNAIVFNSCSSVQKVVRVSLFYYVIYRIKILLC